MGNTKRRIVELFGKGYDPVEAAKGLADDELECLLDGMRSPIPFPVESERNALSAFLYAGAARFDRWRIPTPYVVPATHAERFKKFVRALRVSERRWPTNCATFELHMVKNRIFRNLSGRPMSAITGASIREFRRQLDAVPGPAPADQWDEFKAHRESIREILDGIENNSLRTIISTRIPYPIVKQATQVQLLWNGLSITVDLRPEFRPSEESMMGAGNGVMISLGASRWQTGVTNINLTVEALVDGSAYTEALQAIPGHAFASEGWPQSFTFAFSVIHDLVWQLRDKHAGLQDWIPAPRDLSDVEYSIQTSTSPRLEFIRRGSPASLMQIFVPPNDVTKIELGELNPLPWFQECRLRAGMYLELGDANEALFWVNVAAEALMAQRFVEIETWTGAKGLADQLGGPREFWAQAEEIVAKQFPAMKGKVKWPVAAIHVSVFGKLKVLYRRVKMLTTLDELLGQYKKISSNRNQLFHGNSAARVRVQDVTRALDALSWIDENMRPAPGEHVFSIV